MQITTKKLLMALALVVVAFWTTPGMANLIQNGSFEQGITTIPDNPGFVTVQTGDTTSITDWTVTAGTVDYIGSYWTASQGVRSIDMTGTPGNGTMASTQFLTTVGATYEIFFDMSGNFVDGQGTTRSMQVSVTGGPSITDYSNVFTFTEPAGWSVTNMGWQTMGFTFTALTSETTLSFQALGNDTYCGPALDNVRGSLVPIPGALLLLGAGLVRLTAYGRRRRSQAI
jgi:choice-of-anchor C domain-containing protein